LHNVISIFICGGGTGGHVFPAIAIGEALKRLRPDIDVQFVGAKGKLEMEKVPKAGFKIHPLWIGGIRRGKILSNLSLPFKLISSLLKSLWLVLSHKPKLGIGVGGYASGPFLQVLSMLGKPIMLQEQNAYPGITNKLLGKRAEKICVAYNGLDRFFDGDRLVNTGNPVREIFTTGSPSPENAFKHFELDATKTTVFVTGGSLGAGSINKVLAKKIDFFKQNNIQLIWQCGKTYYETYKHINEPEQGIWVNAFIDKMDYAYACADIVVSRAGALSIAEQQVLGKAVILVPSPNVAEDHQTKNAQALVDEQAAVMVKDAELKQSLIPAIEQLTSNEELRNELSNNLKAMAKTNAAEIIAKQAIELIK